MAQGETLSNKLVRAGRAMQAGVYFVTQSAYDAISYTHIYYYPDCETMTDVAYYYIDELQALGDIPPSLQNYIDDEAYGRDLDMCGCFIETSRGMCEIPY